MCGLSSAGTISCWGEDNGSENLDAPEGIFVEVSVESTCLCTRRKQYGDLLGLGNLWTN